MKRYIVVGLCFLIGCAAVVMPDAGRLLKTSGAALDCRNAARELDASHDEQLKAFDQCAADAGYGDQ